MSATLCLATASFGLLCQALSQSRFPSHLRRQVERLDRGLVAINRGNGEVFLSWRLFSDDPDNISFNLYRATGRGSRVRLNADPIRTCTSFTDTSADLTKTVSYFVQSVANGRAGPLSRPFTLPAGSPARPYLAIPLRTPPGYTPNDAAVGDLDGDGAYEIVLKQEMRGMDNAQRGVCPGTTKLEAYRLDGTFLWRIDLGKNIREGAHYTPFIVFDLDRDGIAEVAARTAEGTTDGTGTTIGDVNGDGRTDYVNPKTGYILEGPEFISIFGGRTGRELARVDYIPRGAVADWGDSYGNRVDRFLLGVGYLDGRRPSLIVCRGYYALTKVEAWSYRNGRLARLWRFSSADPGHEGYAGQGSHSLSIGDVDGDGRDEIVYGACCIDDDGSGLYTTGLGHGDALQLSDMDPSRPGLEVFAVHESYPSPAGMEFRDAATGKLIWGLPSNGDVGRGAAMDVDPRFQGYELWAAGGGLTGGLYNCRGEKIANARLPCNMGVWWDGDLLREILSGITVSKWDWQAGIVVPLLTAEGCAANNGSKANPCLCADILGDWREEVLWRSADNTELRVYVATTPTEYRLPTLMHDPVYRIAVALQNVGYNQSAQPGFYLGEGMPLPIRSARSAL